MCVLLLPPIPEGVIEINPRGDTRRKTKERIKARKSLHSKRLVGMPGLQEKNDLFPGEVLAKEALSGAINSQNKAIADLFSS